jgi:hypothetical protein
LIHQIVLSDAFSLKHLGTVDDTNLSLHRIITTLQLFKWIVSWYFKVKTHGAVILSSKTCTVIPYPVSVLLL